MTARRRSSFPRQTRRTPNRTWNALTSTSFTTVGATSKVLIATAAASPEGVDLTILRTRGVFVASKVSPSADQLITGAMGIMIVTDLAAAAGAASIPGPATDASDDGWFVHEMILDNIEFGTAVGTQTHRGQRFDSKAKRVFQEGQTLVVMVENLSAVSFSFAINLRCLDMVRGTG